ncbi:MAG: elongation factor 1-beta [Nanoarchaeota archaeon]|nr:elongation factor 1-beta [DPANN group archaeon]MBL7116777.1 elongation factor 1-beta [Nanoarchaeota archaeon]
MTNAIVTVKIMPVSPDVDLEAVKEKALEEIKTFAGEGDTKSEIQPVAFGLNALSIIFIMDESLGSPDVLAEKVEAMDGVNSAEITDVRRAVG